MKPPELTYQYRQLIDTSAGTLAIVQRRNTLTGAAIQLDAELYVVPGDKVFILTALGIAGSSGTGQICRKTTARIVEENAALTDLGYNIAYAPDVENATAGLDVLLSWCGELWLGPGERIAARSTYDAGAIANTMVSGMSGLLIPRANVQQA